MTGMPPILPLFDPTAVALHALREDIAELRVEIREVKTEQRQTRDTFQRAKGALYILTFIGGCSALLTFFGHAILQWIVNAATGH